VADNFRAELVRAGEDPLKWAVIGVASLMFPMLTATSRPIRASGARVAAKSTAPSSQDKVGS
jgi:hypothetical protein